MPQHWYVALPGPLLGLACLFLVGCGGAEVCAPPGALPSAEVAAEFPHHARYIGVVYDVIASAESSEEAVPAALRVESYLHSMSEGDRALGPALVAIEQGMSAAQRERWESGMAPHIVRAHQDLDAMLARLADEEPVAAKLAAMALSDWLQGGAPQ